MIEYGCCTVEYGCRNTNPCQKVKTQWTWRVISIIAENKPHAHHKTHFHTMKVFNARQFYSLAIEVFTEVCTCSKVINAFKRSDRIRGPPRSGKARQLLRQSFLSFLHKIEHGAVTRSDSYPQFPRSPLVTPRTMIPLLARTPVGLTTYCAGLCFKSSVEFLWGTSPFSQLRRLVVSRSYSKHVRMFRLSPANM